MTPQTDTARASDAKAPEAKNPDVKDGSTLDAKATDAKGPEAKPAVKAPDAKAIRRPNRSRTPRTISSPSPWRRWRNDWDRHRTASVKPRRRNG